MSEPSICSEATILLDEIRSLKRKFDVDYEQFVRTKDPSLKTSLRDQQKVLTKKLDTLNELLWWQLEIEERLDLRKQYDTQVAIIHRFLAPDRRPDESSQSGYREYIRGIDGVTYPIPEFSEVVAHLKAGQERLQSKVEQGFRKLLLVPFAMSIGRMTHLLINYLIEGSKQEGARYKVDPSSPLMVYNSQYETLEDERTILYYAQPSGVEVARVITKHALLADRSRENLNSWDKGWHVLLVQEDESGQGVAQVPTHAQQKVRGNKHPRQDIVAGESPETLLQEFRSRRSGRYGEKGMAPEEWIMAFLTHLEETGTFLDKLDTAVILMGAYFQNAKAIPCARSTSGGGVSRAILGQLPSGETERHAARTVVQV